MQLKLLWELQEVDLAIKALKEKIEQAPLLSGIDETKGELEKLRIDLEEKENKLREDRKTLKSLEMKTQKIVDDRKALNENMYNGTVSNVKELEQMHRKMDLLADEKKRLEDDILVLMESVEEQDELFLIAEEELKNCEAVLREKEERLKVDLGELNAELENQQGQRILKAEKIEIKHMNKYTMLAEKNQGQVLARVVDDLCGGCRVFISSGLRGHLYNPDAIVYCENCGRLLVKIDDPQ